MVELKNFRVRKKFKNIISNHFRLEYNNKIGVIAFLLMRKIRESARKRGKLKKRGIYRMHGMRRKCR